MTPDQYNIDHTDSAILLANDSNGELLQRVPAILETDVDRQAWNRMIEDINATCVRPFVEKVKCYQRLFCLLPLVMIGSFGLSMATFLNDAADEISISNFLPIILAMLGVPLAFCALAREIARVGEQAKVVLLSKLNEVNASKQFPNVRLEVVILQRMVNRTDQGARAVDSQHLLARIVSVPQVVFASSPPGASVYPSEKHFATQQPAPSAPAAIDAAPVQPGHDFDPPSNTAASSGGALSDELERLSDLRQQGMLTEEEFAAAKRRALGL